MIGNGIPVLVRRALFHVEAPEDLAANVITSMLAYSRKYYCEKSTLMHGVKDCLEGLKKRGIPMSICTNKDETVAQMVVSALGLSSYFNAIVGSRPELAKKPDPSMLQIAAGAISSPMKTTMMIGDSEVDAATGIAASSISVIVRGGYCHKPYNELNVTHLLDSMEELLDIIDNQYLISG